MSISLLKGPEQYDVVDVTIDANPYAGSLLGAYTAEQRALILASLPDDLDDDADLVADDADIEVTAVETVDFGLHTYSPDMRAEIVDSLHDEDDGAVHLSPAAIEKLAAKPDMREAVQGIRRSGRHRSKHEAA